MSTVTAFIRISTSNKNKSANVRFRLRNGRNVQLFHKSELSVSPDKWDEKQQKIKARCIIDEQVRKAFDTAVNDRKALIKSIYLEKGKTLTTDVLDLEIDKALHPERYETTSKIQTLFQFLDKFIVELPQRKHKATGRFLTYQTIQNYRNVDKQIREFVKIVYKKNNIYSIIIVHPNLSSTSPN